jgi:selenocysteine lyase/cysteine desulfurase
MQLAQFDASLSYFVEASIETCTEKT